MLKLRCLYFSLTFICAVQTHNALSIELSNEIQVVSICCSIIAMAYRTMPLLYAFQYHRLVREKSNKTVTSNAPENIIALISQEAETKNIKNIKICIKDNVPYEDYGSLTCQNLILIKSESATELEELLNQFPKNTANSGSLSLNTKNTQILSSEQQKIFNHHIATIHHELTHIQNNDSASPIYEYIIGTIISFIITTPAFHALTKVFPILINDLMIHSIFKLARAVTELVVALYIANSKLYSKYTELRADDGVSNTKELLKNQFEYYLNCHNNVLQEIDIIKNISWKKIIWDDAPEYPIDISTLQTFAIKIIPKQLLTNRL